LILIRGKCSESYKSLLVLHLPEFADENHEDLEFKKNEMQVDALIFLSEELLFKLGFSREPLK
jgi:hypothetical protein